MQILTWWTNLVRKRFWATHPSMLLQGCLSLLQMMGLLWQGAADAIAGRQAADMQAGHRYWPCSRNKPAIYLIVVFKLTCAARVALVQCLDVCIANSTWDDLCLTQICIDLNSSRCEFKDKDSHWIDL
jgi:hypothetical protein